MTTQTGRNKANNQVDFGAGDGIRITFLGAAREVTGSCYLVQTGRARVLVDCGMFQGHDRKFEQNSIPPELPTDTLDAVILTHAHLDHSGRLPLLVKAGYTGPIYCTAPTAELGELILRDSAKVQLQDLERINRKRMRAHEPPLDPLYDNSDIDRVRALFRTVDYDTPVRVADGVTVRLVEAGHLLGSASVIMHVENGNGAPRCLVFSGDLGQRGAPILRDPARIQKADVVVLEATYGDRDHKPLPETVAEFESIVTAAVKRQGKILVPTFAVGRAQALLYVLAIMFREKKVPKFPVYLDSPMAIEATRIYLKHMELFDEEFQALQREHPLMDDLDTFSPVVTAQESMSLNECPGPCLIMAGAGMCTAGRILHHLKHNLWRPETSVIIVGYQAHGTLGRMLVDGAEHVQIFGEKIAVKASIHTLGGFSAHAGQSELLNWFESIAHCKPELFVTHGEPRAIEALTAKISERFGLSAVVPEFGWTREVGTHEPCTG